MLFYTFLRHSKKALALNSKLSIESNPKHTRRRSLRGLLATAATATGGHGESFSGVGRGTMGAGRGGGYAISCIAVVV